jgi:hypothetical protein
MGIDLERIPRAPWEARMMAFPNPDDYWEVLDADGFLVEDGLPAFLAKRIVLWRNSEGVMMRRPSWTCRSCMDAEHRSMWRIEDDNDNTIGDAHYDPFTPWNDAEATPSVAAGAQGGRGKES